MSREVTVFDTDFNYQGIFNALKTKKIAMTIEFFPEEGKYHFTGHRNCNIRHSPSDTAKVGIICYRCNKKLTVGVMHRVAQLAEKGRPEGFCPRGRPAFKRTVPLLEILAESLGQRVNSNKIVQEYKRMVTHFGSEMNILLKVSPEDLAKAPFSRRVAEGIDRVRQENIVVEPGFDGVFGVVKIWPAATKESAPVVKPKPALSQAQGQTRLPNL